MNIKFPLITGAEALTIRSKLGASQTEFWGPIGVTQSGGSRYESGRNIPRPTQLVLAARYGHGKVKAKALQVLGVAA